jgi:hypothetical protein
VKGVGNAEIGMWNDEKNKTEDKEAEGSKLKVRQAF